MNTLPRRTGEVPISRGQGPWRILLGAHPRWDLLRAAIGRPRGPGCLSINMVNHVRCASSQIPVRAEIVGAMGFEVGDACICMPALLLLSCVTWGGESNLSEPQLFHLQNEIVTSQGSRRD